MRAVDAEPRGFVHWGATSQDIVDTALVLLVAPGAAAIMADDHARLIARRCATLSDDTRRRHARAHAAAAGAADHVRPEGGRLARGDRAAAGARLERAPSRGLRRCSSAARPARWRRSATSGLAVAEALARELGLPCPDAPWHAHRDRLAALVAACGIYTGALGKMARDIALLMQHEVAEAAEPGGGSSAMPHKRNPVGCAVALAAAARMPGLVGAAIAGLAQEHERGVGGWQAEWPTIADAVQATGAALAAMRDVTAGLRVDPARMRANIAATNGAIFAERVMMRARRALGRDTAQALLREVVDASARDRRAARPRASRAHARARSTSLADGRLRVDFDDA